MWSETFSKNKKNEICSSKSVSFFFTNLKLSKRNVWTLRLIVYSYGRAPEFVEFRLLREGLGNYLTEESNLGKPSGREGEWKEGGEVDGNGEELGGGGGNIGDADAAPILVKTDYGGLEEKGGGVVYTSLAT